MIDINPVFNNSSQPDRGASSSKPQNTGSAGQYDRASGVVSFPQIPDVLRAALNSNGVLAKLNIGKSEKIGFKLEEGKLVETYSGLLPEPYASGLKTMGSPPNTRIMSAFISRGTRDIHIASILILPDGRNAISVNPALNSVPQNSMLKFMYEVDGIASPIRAAALRTQVKKADTEIDDMSFYKLDNLDSKYQPLIDYMHGFQRTDPKTAPESYLAIRKIAIGDLPQKLRQGLEQEPPVTRGEVKLTDKTQVVFLSLSSSPGKASAPVILFTNTTTPIASVTEDFLAFINQRKDITMPDALELIRELYNQHVT